MQQASRNKSTAGQPSVGNTTASRFKPTGFSGPGLSQGSYDMEALGRDPPAPNRKGADRVERPPLSVLLRTFWAYSVKPDSLGLRIAKRFQ